MEDLTQLNRLRLQDRIHELQESNSKMTSVILNFVKLLTSLANDHAGVAPVRRNEIETTLRLMEHSLKEKSDE